MRQSMKALGWATTILRILFFAFLVLVIYSLTEIAMATLSGQGIRIGEMNYESRQEVFTMSLPLTINNTGSFEISEFRIAATFKDSAGISVAEGETVFERVPSGSSISKTLNVSVSIIDLINRNFTRLLFNDSEIMLDLGLGMRYAGLFGFNVTVPGAKFPWGAPFKDIQLGSPSEPQPVPGNPDKASIRLPIQFKNNSPIGIYGTIYMKLFDDKSSLLGSGNKTIEVVSGAFCSEDVEIELDLKTMQNFTGKGYLEIKLETPSFTLNFPRVEYGGR